MKRNNVLPGPRCYIKQQIDKITQDCALLKKRGNSRELKKYNKFHPAVVCKCFFFVLSEHLYIFKFKLEHNSFQFIHC